MRLRIASVEQCDRRPPVRADAQHEVVVRIAEEIDVDHEFERVRRRRRIGLDQNEQVVRPRRQRDRRDVPLPAAAAVDGRIRHLGDAVPIRGIAVDDDLGRDIADGSDAFVDVVPRSAPWATRAQRRERVETRGSPPPPGLATRLAGNTESAAAFV
jgi:hypothetical protein